MQFAIILEEIFQSQAVSNAQGDTFALHSAIDKAEGNFLHQLVLQYKPQNTLEIGCAYGISSLYICGGLQKNKQESNKTGMSYQPKHTIIDPFQTTQWKSVGIDNLKKANLDCFELVEKPSELAMPALLAAGQQFDMIFIDGWHTFDHTLLDLFYANRLLNVGGILVVDDVATIKPVNKALRYFLNYPAYQYIGKAPFRYSFKKKLYYTLSEILSLGAYLLPFRKQILHGNLIASDRQLNIDSSMIAFEKVAADNRNWNWYSEF
jgi:predicted O-methyltransferase YrrM